MTALLANFPAIINIIRLEVDNLKDLLNCRKRSQVFKDAVDNYVFDIWARLLTKKAIEFAFEKDCLYLLKQAHKAQLWRRNWIENQLQPWEKASLLDNIRLDMLAGFPFENYFVKNDHRDIDDFCIGELGFLNIDDKHNRTALWYAIENENIERTRYLLAKGIDTSSYNSHRRAYVYFAVDKANLSLVELLVEAGCDVNAKDEGGRTALFRATGTILSYLLSIKGIDVNIADFEEKTPLVAALERGPKCGSASDIELLIKTGANIEKQQSLRRTPIYDAIHSSWLYEKDYIDIMLKAGANVNVVDRDGRTPLMHYIQMMTHTNTNANQDKEVVSNINKFLDKGADIQAVDIDQENIIHIAHKNLSLLKNIISIIRSRKPKALPIMINAKEGNAGHTPLHNLASDGERNQEQIYLLMLYGANPNIKNNDGKTAAEMMGSSLYMAITLLLPQPK